MSAILELADVTRVHGAGSTQVTALSRVSLTVPAGEFIAVMGPSGSGKSTLLTIAGGLDVPTSGSVVIEGTDIAGASVAARSAMRRRSIGYVFQDLNLISALTAAENVALPLELDGQKARRARASALEALRTMDIAELADRFPDEMSGGQQQRVAIARAMVGERRLLLADEPTGALDSATGEAVIAVLRQRCDEGLACVMVTHEARLAAWADRTVFLRDGVLIDDSGPRIRAEDLVADRAAG